MNFHDNLSAIDKRVRVVVQNDVGLLMALAPLLFLSWHEPLTVELMAIYEALKFCVQAGS